MAAPEVPISVDPATGIWSTDGLPMIYLPRHFFVNYHRAVEAALGREKAVSMAFEPGRLSAFQWCAKEAVTHGIAGTDVFHHYMKRLSQRGWGQFAVEALDPEAGTGRIRVDHSIFVDEAAEQTAETQCYLYAGWFPGALEWVREESGLTGALQGREIACAAQGGDHCVFEISPT